MKVTAHLLVAKGYGRAISASQFITEMREAADECNRDMFGDEWKTSGKDRAVITVEFDVLDSLFDPPPDELIVQALVINK